MEAKAKAGEQISLTDLAAAVKAEEKAPKAKKSHTAKPKKPSIRAQLDAAKKEQSKQTPPREKTKELEVYIKNKIPMAKKAAVCSYTVEGRALIHTNLSMNSSVLSGLRNQPSMGRSTELTDSRISLFSAQRGKCALSGELFENAADIVCWLKTPAELGGKERYRNMILFHNRFLPLLQECPKNELKEIADTLKATKELMLKVNSLRQQAGLSAIEN